MESLLESLEIVRPLEVVHCTDDEKCGCEICRSIRLGMKDAEGLRGMDLGKQMLATCLDEVHGKPRFTVDNYWGGVYTVLSE